MFVSTLPIFGRNANKKLVPQQAGEPSCKTEQPLLPWKSVDLESAFCKLNHYGLQNDAYCTVCWHNAETWRTGDEFSLAQQSCRRKWLGKRNLCGALRRRCAHCGYIELKSQINKMSIYRRTLIHKFVWYSQLIRLKIVMKAKTLKTRVSRFISQSLEVVPGGAAPRYGIPCSTGTTKNKQFKIYSRTIYLNIFYNVQFTEDEDERDGQLEKRLSQDIAQHDTAQQVGFPAVRLPFE